MSGPPTAPAPLWSRALSGVFVVCAASAASCAATWAFHTLKPEPPAAPTATTVVRSTGSVITSIRDLATVEGASYHLERVIDLRDRQQSVFGLVESEDAVLLVAAGDVVAGVDLASMRDGDVTIDLDARIAHVTLPPPTVLSARLDNDRTYVHTRTTGALARRAETLETRARQEAERTLRKDALSAGILERARTNATRTVKTLLHSLGFVDVQVTYRQE